MLVVLPGLDHMLRKVGESRYAAINGAGPRRTGIPARPAPLRCEAGYAASPHPGPPIGRHPSVINLR